VKILINQKPIIIENDQSKKINLNQALEVWSNQTPLNEQLHEQEFAIAINQTFIPKNIYHSTYLYEGDQVELLIAMQGG
jgi:thiamine biosynthesis protein ThiS